MPPRVRRTTAACLVALAGCETPPPPPLTTPAVSIHMRYFPAPGSTTDPVKLAGILVSLQIYAVAAPPPAAPLVAAMRLVRHESPPAFGGHPRALNGVLIATGPEATATLDGWQAPEGPDRPAAVLAGARDLVVLPHAVALVECSLADGTALPSVRLAPTPDGASHLALHAANPHGEGETVELDAPLPVGGPPLLVFVPAPAAPRQGFVLALCVRDVTVPPAMLEPAMQAALDDFAAWRAAVTPADPDAIATAMQIDVFQRVFGERERRPALLALANHLQASLTNDLALIADEALLVAIARTLGEREFRRIEEGKQSWQLERTAMETLVRRLRRGNIPPAFHAFLHRHLGAVGDNWSLLQELLRSSDDIAEFRAGLHRENHASLADDDPATRCLATEWLRSNDAVPAGYDPLADAATRTAALQAFEQAQTAAKDAAQHANPAKTREADR